LISIGDAALASWERRLDELVAEIDALLAENKDLARTKARSEDVSLVRVRSPLAANGDRS
jgi:hypothetical protein